VNVLFVSPHFPPQYVHFCAALRAEGARVLGLGDVPWASLPAALQPALDDYAHVPDLDDAGAAEQTARSLVARHGTVDRVDSLNEHWLPLEARLREALGAWGPRSKEVAGWRSKTAQREALRNAGVACTEGVPVRDAASVRSFVARHGLPVVIKPDIGVGAARTFRVSTDEELERALQEPLAGFVVERWEAGALTSYDGLVDREGRIVFELSHVFSGGVMEVVNERRTPWYYTRRDLPESLARAGRQAVAALGLRERFFHVELFEQASGVRVLEVNVRPPGGFTTDLMNWACDTDVYRLWARALTGADLAGFAYERRWHAAHVGRRRETRYRLDHGQLVAELGGALMDHRTLPPLLARAMGDDVYLLRDVDESRLRRMIEMATAVVP
jgi:hypothetical protein